MLLARLGRIAAPNALREWLSNFFFGEPAIGCFGFDPVVGSARWFLKTAMVTLYPELNTTLIWNDGLSLECFDFLSVCVLPDALWAVGGTYDVDGDTGGITRSK